MADVGSLGPGVKLVLGKGGFMAFLEWQDKFDIHVPEMNLEHKELIRLMNKLHDEVEKKSSKDLINKTFDELGAYVVRHFKDEEAYMESVQFPNLAGHKKVHEDLLEKLTVLAKDFKAGKEGIEKDLFKFLRMWLSAHICGLDMKYGEHSDRQKMPA